MGVLDGKVALVTGGAGGVGSGVCRAYAKEGAAIAVVDINADAVNGIVAELNGLGARALDVTCDISDPAAVTAAVERVVAEFGTVDILVNVAQAAAHDKLFEDLTDEDFALAINTGPLATSYFMRRCFPYLKGDGRVINFRSASEIAGLPMHGAYIAAKGAIASMTKAAAREWGKYGITVNCINPFVMHERALQHFEQFPDQLESIYSSLSIPRNGNAETDIGRAAVYLAGPDASFVTGCTLSVDGGGAFL